MPFSPLLILCPQKEAGSPSSSRCSPFFSLLGKYPKEGALSPSLCLGPRLPLLQSILIFLLPPLPLPLFPSLAPSLHSPPPYPVPMASSPLVSHTVSALANPLFLRPQQKGECRGRLGYIHTRWEGATHHSFAAYKAQREAQKCTKEPSRG